MTEQAQAPRITFFATPPHSCPYLPDQHASTIFADPRVRMNFRLHTLLSRHGFRRSGAHVYRPQCADCHACIAVRVVVDAFQPHRTDRRCLMRNQQLILVDRPAEYDAEHFALYRKYLGSRHAGGGMDDPTPTSYLDFLTAAWARTRFLEFRDGATLLAVAVIDELEDGLSATYTFFDPDVNSRGLGRFAILRQIELARARGLPWLYLGYWIAASRKMSYKTHFQPLEYFVEGRWRRTLV